MRRNNFGSTDAGTGTDTDADTDTDTDADTDTDTDAETMALNSDTPLGFSSGLALDHDPREGHLRQKLGHCDAI